MRELTIVLTLRNIFSDLIFPGLYEATLRWFNEMRVTFGIVSKK